MRLTIKLFFLVVFLTGCVNSQSTLAPTPTTHLQTSSTTATLPTLAVILTPTITPTSAFQEIKVSLQNNYTFLDGFSDQVNSLAWARDGKTLIIASRQKYLVYFDTQSKEVTINPVGDMPISYIALSPDQKNLAVSPDSRFMDKMLFHLVNLATGKVIKTIKIEKPFVFEGKTQIVYDGSGIFAPDGKTFILNSGRQITLWDVASGNQIKKLFESDSSFFISGLFLNPAKNLLFASYYKYSESYKGKTFLRWKTNTWETTETFTGNFTGFSFSPDGNTFALISKETTMGQETIVLDSNTFTKLLTFTDSENLGLYTGRVVAYDPKGEYVAVGGNGNVTIYNASTGKLINRLDNIFWRLEVLEFSPDGTRLAAGGGAEGLGIVKIWDLNQP